MFGSLTPEQNERYARAFELNRNANGFVPDTAGRRELEKSGLSDAMLQQIWNLSDLDRDRRLSLREFVCALHLADQAKGGRALPHEVRPDQQASIAQGVERIVSHGQALGSTGKPAVDAFSTADTHMRSAGGFDSTAGGFGGRSEASEAGFSTVGSRLGGSQTRGRDPAPRPLGEGAGAGEASSLGQLAAVFEVVARLDQHGDLRRLSSEVLQERRELERQLSRRRDLEKQLKEARSAQDSLKDDQRQVEVEAKATQRRIQHLQDELLFVEAELRSAEEDLHLLKSETLVSGDSGRRGPAPYSSPEEERRDVLSRARAERELLQKDQREIEDLRLKLDEIFRQKQEVQALQQGFLEKQRQTEQDRGLMLTAIEAERGKLCAMRAERLRLWEERSDLERALADLAQEQSLTARRPSARQPGVPASAQFNSAPSEMTSRQRGIPQDQVPAVVYGPPPGVSDQRGLGYGGGASYPPRSAPTNGGSGGYTGGAQLRSDRRGVRNEAPQPAGGEAAGAGWQGFGGSSLGGLGGGGFGAGAS